MQVDDPPYLSVGTAVSAKYKGAFCEAKVSRVVRMVKCKVTYKMGLGIATINDSDIKGTLRVGQVVQAKHPDRKEFVECTITKIQDCSQYTVVFDDGDITTLRRTALCLKSGRHFNESETLDQLPLTHPEHFGNPVMGGRRGRRNRHLKDDSSDEEFQEDTHNPDLEGYSQDIGKVVSIETSEKKRGKDSWFPGVVVVPSPQLTVRVNIKDEYLIRSFKDGRYYTVPKKEVSEFNREMAQKAENPALVEAVQKAIRFLDYNDLPLHWDKNSLFNTPDNYNEDNVSDTSDDEPSEEKDRFVAQLYKFMDDSGTPMNKTPTVSNRDIDLHRLFRLVQKMGGYNRVTNHNKWLSVTEKLKMPNSQNVASQIKLIYKKCLQSYETFYRALGVTMHNPVRSSKKTVSAGRSLIRDKDRSTPVNSPKLEKEDEFMEKLEEKKETPIEKVDSRAKKKIDMKEKKARADDTSDTNGGDTDTSELNPGSSGSRPKRKERKLSKDKKSKPTQPEMSKQLPSKSEDVGKKEEKVQQTRSRSKELKDTPKLSRESTPKALSKVLKKTLNKDDDKKSKGKKKSVGESSSDSGNTTDSSSYNINVGDKLSVYYGPTNESKVTYEAKVVDIDKDQTGPIYLVHYTGWNTRYDEWIPTNRIAENLSTSVKTKKIKTTTPSSKSTSAATSSKQTASKRARGGSISSRLTVSDQTPRSTSPSSITSSSSRTKSPATPITRSNRLAAKQDFEKRRISAQTDVSVLSDSESDISESETELPRTRSGSIKTEESEIKTYRNRVKPALLAKAEKRKDLAKDAEDTEKEDETETLPKKPKRIKKVIDKSADESDEDSLTHPKGRDFDLNQIRSELKGFTKALKVSSSDSADKESIVSSEESVSPPTIEKEEEKLEETVEPKLPDIEKSLSSDDVYEFKEPEPFEFEARSKLIDEKNVKKRLPRLFEELDKSPKHKISKSSSDRVDEPVEKRTYSRIPVRDILDDTEEDEEEEDIVVVDISKEVDPFDKLVESPSFNLIKCSPEKPVENKPPPIQAQNLLEEPLSLFRELPETADEYSGDMELSDCESQTQIFTRSDDLFASSFSKPSPDRNTLDMEFSSGKTDEGKTTNSDEDDMLQAQIQRVIAQSSSTDDDSNDTLLASPSLYHIKPEEESKTLSILGITAPTPILEPQKEEVLVESSDDTQPEKEVQLPEEKEAGLVIKQISPALQETDSSLLESIVSKPPMILDPKVDDTGKELTVKTGTKIADSILQKFSFIKNNMDTKNFIKTEQSSVSGTFKGETKSEVNTEPENNDTKLDTDEIEMKVNKEETTKEENILPDPKVTVDIIKPLPLVLKSEGAEMKKRKRSTSQTFEEDYNSDSSDSEQLVIVRSDDESHTEFLLKPSLDSKDNENSNTSLQKTSTDETESQPEERNFKFDCIQLKEDSNVEVEELKEPEVLPEIVEIETVNENKEEETKEEQQESNLHSSLYCEEEIPRSPAPVPESSGNNDVQNTPSVHEIPFASAPGMSNSKMLLDQKRLQPAPLILPTEKERRGGNVQAVIDNTPPTTPETTVSNLSPRDENDDISNTNDSGKSIDGEPEYPTNHPRSSLVKLSPYSEEDTQMVLDYPSSKRPSDSSFGPPVGCRKRRRSLRTSEDALMPPAGGAKRGRKPLNRQRRDSDSDDASEHSTSGSVGGTTPGSTTSIYDRSSRSPRPSKYNFFVEFDPSLDSTQRIAVLQQKLSELRKTYADVKTELAAVERRRKKIRRREREALKTAKQEMACA